ncbi:MAG: TonB-dependent receptor, partial [Acidobacteria bacterium]|nr:TonB-dependent receptor [Acidobacteriota bacterium]
NSTESIDYVYDLNVAHGGPLIRDKFWFFGSARRFSINVPVTDSYYKNENGTAPRYMANAKYPDGTEGLRLGINDDRITSGLLRLTYQVTQNNKFSAYIDRIIKQRFHDYDARADVATASRHHGSPLYYIGAAKWTSTLSSRLLLEAGYSTNVANWSNVDQEADVPNGPGLGLRGGGVGKQTQNFDQAWPTCVATPCYPGVGGYPHLGDAGLAAQLPGSGVDGGGIHPFYANTLRRDTTNDFLDRYHWGNRLAYVERFNTNVSMSYVTGSHNLKVGFMSSWAPFRLTEQWNGSLRQRYRAGVPYQINRANTDVDYSLFYRDLSGYVQDTWTIDRLTLNLGLRIENIVGTVEPTERLLRTRFTQPTILDGQDNIPNWSNIAPRLGLAYDLFGDASTALKFSWGRYNSSITHSLASALATGKVTGQGLAWFDCAMITSRHGSASNRCATMDELNMISPGLGAVAYGNSGLTDWGGAKEAGSVPNHGTNGDDYVQDWELGLASADFGQGTSTPVLDPNLSRPWSALTNIGIERELLPGLSTSFNYYRRDTQSAILLVDRAISLSDYTLFSFANPCATAGTPGSGGFGCTTNGSTVPGTLPVYVLNPEAQGRTPDRVYTNTNSSTGYDEAYEGFESGFNARLPNGTTVFGAWTLERNVITRCDSQDDPNKLLFCDRSGVSPLTGQDVGAAYNVPWLNEFKLSGTVPLPGDFQFSATFQSYNPRELLATTSFSGDSASGLNGGGNLWGSLLALGNVGYSVPSSAIEEAGVAFTRSPFIPLMPPGSTYLDRLQQFDISIRKVFEMGSGRRLNVQADIYNMLNSGPVLEATNRYGSGLGRPRRTIQGRFLQFATHLYW